MTPPSCTLGPWDSYQRGLVLSEDLVIMYWSVFLFFNTLFKSVKLSLFEIVAISKVHISQKERKIIGIIIIWLLLFHLVEAWRKCCTKAFPLPLFLVTSKLYSYTSLLIRVLTFILCDFWFSLLFQQAFIEHLIFTSYYVRSGDTKILCHKSFTVTWEGKGPLKNKEYFSVACI